MTNRNLSIDYF